MPRRRFRGFEFLRQVLKLHHNPAGFLQRRLSERR
jgi:hypothetical protein